LREGLDLPEVSLVAILDADKEGFLRSHRSLTQTIGRAARHVEGKAIMYADRITNSMQKTIDETNYRREKQIAYNTKHNITPQPLNKPLEDALAGRKAEPYEFKQADSLEAAEEEVAYYTEKQLKERMNKVRKQMELAAKELDFMQAADMRDELEMLKEKLAEKKD